MIRPGLLTASTNKADHLGTSGAGLEWRVVALVWFSFRCAWFGIENAFSPFRSGVEARVAHSDALRRNGSEEPEWSLRNGGCVAGLPCDENQALQEVAWFSAVPQDLFMFSVSINE